MLRRIFEQTLNWVVGRLMQITIEGTVCSACGKVHPFGAGCPWRCPKMLNDE